MKLLIVLLFSIAGFSQPKVYNVQKYCVDEKPFRSQECNISGNEYSFVFVDDAAKSVVFFFTDTKLKYAVKAVQTNSASGDLTYSLAGSKGEVQMKINKAHTKIDFFYPETHIYLTVGKSTKL